MNPWTITLLCLVTASVAAQEINTCVDKDGNKRIQSFPCDTNAQTAERKMVDESGRQAATKSTAASKIKANTVKSGPTDKAFEQRVANASATRMNILTQALNEADARPGNRGYILASALCNVAQQLNDYEPAIRKIERQALLVDAQTLGDSYPANRGLYRPAAMGQCPARYATSPPPVNATPAPRSAIDTRTGQVLPGVGGGVINPRTGQFMPDVGGGYIDPQTGRFIPKL